MVITGASPEEDDVDDEEEPNRRPSFRPFLMKNGTGKGTATKGRCTAREEGEPGAKAPLPPSPSPPFPLTPLSLVAGGRLRVRGEVGAVAGGARRGEVERRCVD